MAAVIPTGCNLSVCVRGAPKTRPPPPGGSAPAALGRGTLGPHLCTFTVESRPWGGFFAAETLFLNGTVGDNGNAGGTLNQPVLGFLVDETPSGPPAFRPVT